MVFFFKHKTAYEMRISDWSSDVCSSDLHIIRNGNGRAADNLPVAVLVPKAWNDRVEPVPARFVGRIGKIIEQVRACDGRDRNAGRIDHAADRSEEHTSELQSLMRISYAVFCLKKKIIKQNYYNTLSLLSKRHSYDTFHTLI